MRQNAAATLVLAASSFVLQGASAAGNRYKAGDKVELWVNKVGPYANPQEAFEYYALPYCAPETEHHPVTGSDTSVFNSIKSYSGIGERLGGNVLRHTGHDLTFAPDTSNQPIVEECSTGELGKEESDKFAKAARDQWFYQMYLDDLPVWGMVGEMLPDAEGAKGQLHAGESDLAHLDREADMALDPNLPLKPYVYTERTLTIDYNADRIIKVDLTSDPASLVEANPGSKLKFRTFIKWQRTDAEFHSRFDRYLDHAFFKHQIHWFSVFNSFMMVLFLTGLVALILLRTLRRDYARYALITGDEEEGGEVDEDGKPLVDKHSEESGWKQVHGDVFRAPSYLPLFSAVLGTGWQLVVLTLGVILFAVAGPIHGEVHEERGEILHAVVWIYTLSSAVSGYASGKYFKLYSATSGKGAGKGVDAAPSASGPGAGPAQWQVTMFLTVMLLPTISTVVLSFLNGVALYYGTINYIPFLAIFILFLIWIFVSVPLCILGTLIGRHTKLAGKGTGVGMVELFPCRVNSIPRPIPTDVPWYGNPANLVPFAGLLSFGSIFIELYYVLTSLWNYKFYHVYGFLLGVYAILVLVVGMTTVIVTYFTLNAENHLWQWTAFASGASTAAYVFLYGVYYFAFKTSMGGFLQTAFYFGYMALISLNLGVLCGTIGHFTASKFVRTIFQNVKVD
eukprot:CAMPEP_0113554222 /NCGR_PEP_ID=MMETSP0015_2-20120614/16032_1 /TAXON_ID=2838 /ORGANISM="Odontella" /LENGTH=678 /DNA_ID=CAMNT_0000455345 /DNA_START=82 /DNA_END=2118 /DNA_ORIENTATION=+ /assembly_acc=CAM_ASM_000160